MKIPLKDIEFIESLEDYIRIHLQGEKPVMTLMTMKKVLEKLPEDRYRKIHRSYIIPVNKIQAIANRKVKLLSGRELPISDTYSSFINDLKKS
ncbi:LytR/AlgR family response regulator transcription factor [Telluribacter humicola]|uniref:LytR/AlgR family response regulator transcription factor n=1 Tax=Telluribacter humicola TaxID=1720261 RepID=UPI001A958077|nr:LytTR family DNA-binding domain-containing protein [Telluribacter humicola]